MKLEMKCVDDASVKQYTGSTKCISVAMTTGFISTIECIR